MAQTSNKIADDVRAFICAQHVFFVATAPESGGHVNISPKGLDTFAILDPNHVAYLDLTGSGAETIAHISQNGRITVMFCAFEGPPNVVRLYGRADVVRPGADDFARVAHRFGEYPGARAVIRISVDRVSTSCGYGVPLMTFAGLRQDLADWAESKGETGLAAYRAEHNTKSIDGLPGL